MMELTKKRKYRIKRRMVEDVGAYFSTLNATAAPKYYMYRVQMRVCWFVWITIKEYLCKDDYTSHQYAQELLNTLNEIESRL